MFRSRISAVSSAFRTAKRTMGGGGGHDHGHGHAEPAYFLGIKPGAKWEGWEFIAYPTIILCTAIALAPAEDEYFLDWARKEAIARRQAKEEGEEIKFGTYYSQKKKEE